ncbi:MAG: histidine phosphatase family protein [Chloroflexota bacterium]
MMKTLLLMRHGKSSWKDKTLEDKQRPLKKRGQRDCEYIGHVLLENELVPQLILSSTAVRASQSAEVVSKICAIKDGINYLDSFYMGEPEEFLESLKELPDSLERVMIVAHNPGLEALMQIVDGKIDALPTASMAYLVLGLDKWADISFDSTGELIGFWKPSEAREKTEVLMAKDKGKDKGKKKKVRLKDKDKKQKKEKKDKKKKKEDKK